MDSKFEEFKKIPRIFRDCTITEKIDGTNGQILIRDMMDGQVNDVKPLVIIPRDGKNYAIYAGSRNRWVYPGKEQDNSGFAQWVFDRAEGLLMLLGEGRHYGEFWGAGIQRRYGLTGMDKRFSLFNTAKWWKLFRQRELDMVPVPLGLGVVPVLYEGPFRTSEVEDQLFNLKTYGSRCVPNFMDAEGVVVYLHAAGTYFKATVKNDEAPKTLAGIKA